MSIKCENGLPYLLPHYGFIATGVIV